MFTNRCLCIRNTNAYIHLQNQCYTLNVKHWGSKICKHWGNKIFKHRGLCLISTGETKYLSIEHLSYKHSGNKIFKHQGICLISIKDLTVKNTGGVKNN
jgi:hypothetical protein